SSVNSSSGPAGGAEDIIVFVSLAADYTGASRNRQSLDCTSTDTFLHRRGGALEAQSRFCSVSRWVTRRR
ncbi:hypothetical protein OFM36_36495, partial [Escherichia coli]|nr:hypothetical protein [Escherichia coli]